MIQGQKESMKNEVDIFCEFVFKILNIEEITKYLQFVFSNINRSLINLNYFL